MKIEIKATNLELTPAIREYAESKIGSLERFLKRFETNAKLWRGGKSKIEAFIEIARTAKHHRKGDIFYAEATLLIGKKILRAEHSDWNMRVAINKMKEKLCQEISKYKEKKISNKR